MIELADCKAGNIVALERPYKTGAPSRQLMHNVASGESLSGFGYKSWAGFTHGIIAYVERGALEILPREMELARQSAVIFLYLYDPETGSVYMDYASRMPVRVQYSADEMALWKRAKDFGGFSQEGKTGEQGVKR